MFYVGNVDTGISEKMTVKKKKKLVHMAYEYPCTHCGYVDVECGEEVVDNSGTDGWTMDEKKVTCKECKHSIKSYKDARKSGDY